MSGSYPVATCIDLRPGYHRDSTRSGDEEKKQLVYRSNMQKKLACDIVCLNQVYRLVCRNQQSTKRDLYYEQKMLYEKQSSLDRSVTSICDLLDFTRIHLNVVSCSKGILQGAVSFLSVEKSGIINARLEPVLITENLIDYRIINDAEFILVIEKEATFQKIIDEGFFSYFPNSLLVTGKGYPDICTRKVLRHLVERIGIPIFGFFDADPHGIQIYITYKYGSYHEKCEGREAFISSMKWIGLFPSDATFCPISDNQYIPLQNSDFVKIRKLTRRVKNLDEPQVIQELEKLRQMRFKLEMEAINEKMEDE
ncbi:unnamed protein product [Caenorhabditis auriculariae]|uniref:DNA topoisomerase (ATP-hydrolyzing) n=1 Tax=Caenorhabditis auriculariae TaxID=2777116 RepID=A0A8S1HRN0_9PELO|nr:unnamed protein product [Caenorhabditis auriculariae]